MPLLESLSDNAPRIVLAAVIGIGAALLTFSGVFVFTSMRGAGLDFLIIVGFVLSILVGLASSLVAFRLIQSR